MQGSTDGQADVNEAATSVMNSGQKMTKMEAAALADDPKTVEAKTALTAATAKVSGLVVDHEKSAKSDPEFAEKAKALEDAKQKLAEIEKAK